MKYLENLNIEKFRGLRDLELKNLGQINLLVGINNCGKTSVLEALSIYCMPLDITVWLHTLNQRNEMMKNPGRSSVLESLKWLFPQSEAGEKNQISISSTGQFYVQKLIVTSEEIEGLLLSNSEQQIRKGLELDIK
ncbi:MAG TPA: AAA family ATPase, partial [Allocoleopsis sp.]